MPPLAAFFLAVVNLGAAGASLFFAGSYACVGGVSVVLPGDLHIRGGPPSPTALLQRLIALVGGR